MKFKSTLFLIAICLFTATFAEAKNKEIRKAVYIIIDGVPADVIEKVQPPTIDSISKAGGYHRCLTGGEVGTITETPTISAVCYNNILTSTWANKHNVWGNDIKSPNYHYPTLFKVVKDEIEDATIGVFSGWEENRTLLVGDDAVGTGMLHVNYYFDRSDKDDRHYPATDSLRILKLDQDVTNIACRYIINDGPTVSWIYLWFMDEVGHKYGTGDIFNKYLLKVDKQISQIWNAVKVRETKTGEQWLTIVTTDHGRDDHGGHGHGGQSERERTTWIAMDKQGNAHFNDSKPLLATDITPSICNYLNVRVPVKIAKEWEGVPFVGKVDFANFKATKEGTKIKFTWDSYSKNDLTIRVSTTNHYKNGETEDRDHWYVIGRLNSTDKTYEWDCSKMPSDLYRFYLESPNTVESAWITSK